MKKIAVLFLLPLWLAACHVDLPGVKNELRAPAYPLVSIDPYTSGWSFTDNLYDGSVKHWTGADFPFIGAIRVDGQIYRFMGAETPFLKTVVAMAEQEQWVGSYTFAPPPKGWYLPAFDDSAWKKGYAAFGTRHQTAVRTRWRSPNNDIWLRRTFVLSEDIGQQVFLRYSHDDDIVIYINGVEVVNSGYSWGENKQVALSGDALAALKTGENVIAAHCTNRAGEALVDFGLSVPVYAEAFFDQAAVQTSVDVQATQTHYRFTCGAVDLELTFTAPLLLDDLELVSRPVNYLTYRVLPNDSAAHDVSLYFEASPAWALNKPHQESVSEIIRHDGLTFLKTGSTTQEILKKKGDNVRIDWGYFYLCGADSEEYSYQIAAPLASRAAFAGAAIPEGTPAADADGYLSVVHSLGTVSGAVSNNIMLGYDDIYSIQYFGEHLRPYWNRDGEQDILDVFALAASEYRGLVAKCNRFDAHLMHEAAMAGGKEYAELCAVAYRQSIAAHKLVQAPNGDLLFLSKENFSNGSIGTVDVTYPSAPLYLLYNVELCKGLLNHIFYYSESGKWSKPFAAHDVGTYPVADGQTYGGDMPVEETGNMLILTAAIAIREGNARYAERHWDVLTTWADYLVEKGLDPDNQLCTDDFAGHFAHNANLSVKAILGVASYAKLAAMLGHRELAKVCNDKAKAMAKEWLQMADDGDHYRLTFDRPGSWSQKYNLVWNKLLRLNIFPDEVAEKELAFYLTKQNPYGLPLDNRETYTKADWIIWTATLSDDPETFQALVRPVHAFANATPDRVPMSDWYYTDRPNQRGFQARSVVGGFFIRLLEHDK
ncbi:MAG: DUF4965 domain-containing protein [Prevotellaceae bacterium]|jgi:hypothetical protein|nr:DUF4965 domain-containing protein [Prevotellaceae bacterium]